MSKLNRAICPLALFLADSYVKHGGIHFRWQCSSKPASTDMGTIRSKTLFEGSMI